MSNNNTHKRREYRYDRSYGDLLYFHILVLLHRMYPSSGDHPVFTPGARYADALSALHPHARLHRALAAH